MQRPSPIDIGIAPIVDTTNQASPPVQHSMIQDRKYSWLPRLAAEFVVVVMSVLLALAVDQWRGNRALERQVDQARTAFEKEIAGNQALLRDTFGIAYHQAMWDHFKKVSAAYWDGDDVLAQKIIKNERRFDKGIHPPALRDAVWRSLSQSDLIRHMPPETVFLLADIYREQENLDRMFRRMLDVWLEPRPDRHLATYQRDDANVSRMFMADVVASEQRLLKRYEEGLKLLRDGDVER